MSESVFERIDLGSISNFLVVTGKKEFENLTDEDIYGVNILLFLVLRSIGAAKQGIYVFTRGLVLPVNIFWKTERLRTKLNYRKQFSDVPHDNKNMYIFSFTEVSFHSNSLTY